PLNLHQRVALSFAQGDFLTAVLKGGGKLCWEWGGSWDAEGPDHGSVAALMRNLNAWRRGTGKPYLLYGRMLKPFPVAGDYEIPIITPRDQRIPFRSVFTTRWRSGDKTAQVLVNYTPEPQRVTLRCGEAAGRPVLFTDPRAAGTEAPRAGADGLALELSPLNAVLVEWAE
ncbi:MAG TPA: hypothetical protein P5141_09895, partial [Candidatus Hydrogenedentes bacterium]|nr:hypothetical protein [Candidatus Hydrogenedentota bacterium]